MTELLSRLPDHPPWALTIIALATLFILLLERVFFFARPDTAKAAGKTASRLGLHGISLTLMGIVTLFWVGLFLLLALGLTDKIIDILRTNMPETPLEQSHWRFEIAKLAALTAVLGAVVALPFTVIRTILSRRQTEAAEASLMNEKVNAAVEDLHAQRQVTDGEGVARRDIWQDDITRRNGAIDRLRGLVEEDQTLQPRVDRMLTVYLQQLTREYPAEIPPEDATPVEFRAWAQNLQVKRNDMENAVQALSRLPRTKEQSAGANLPDLRGLNMQGFDLAGLHLNNAQMSNAQLQGAVLSGAKLQGADLSGAKLQGADLSRAELQGADLSRAEFDAETILTAATLRGAAVRMVDFTKIPQIADHIDTLFGDDTVKFPPGTDVPDRFNRHYEDFNAAWRAFQRSIGQDPENPT